MDELGVHYASEIRHSQKDVLLESTYMRCPKSSNSEAGGRMSVDRAWGQVEMGSYCSMGVTFQLHKRSDF